MILSDALILPASQLKT